MKDATETRDRETSALPPPSAHSPPPPPRAAPRKALGSRSGGRGLPVALRLVGLALVVLVASELASGMGRAGGPADLDHALLDVRELAGTIVHASEDLGLPMALLVLDDRHLVVADGHLDPAIHVLRGSDGTRVAAFGRGGDGPGEFRSPRSLVPAPGRHDAFWLYDIGLQRLTFVTLADAAGGGPGPDARTLRLRSDAPVTDPIVLADPHAHPLPAARPLPSAADGARLIALGFFPDGRVATFDAEGRRLTVRGPLPSLDRDVPPHLVSRAYQGRMAIRPDGSGLAVASRYAGRLEILSGRGDLLLLAEAPFEFSPRFDLAAGPNGPAMATGADLRFGYVDVAATDTRIYGLFSGRLRGGHPGRAHLGRHVHVFDWSGRLLEVLELDADAFALAVTDDDRRLYALRHLPAPAVVAYTLEASS